MATLRGCGVVFRLSLWKSPGPGLSECPHLAILGDTSPENTISSNCSVMATNLVRMMARVYFNLWNGWDNYTC